MEKTEKKLSLSERIRRTSRTNPLKEGGKKREPIKYLGKPYTERKERERELSKAVEKKRENKLTNCSKESKKEKENPSNISTNLIQAIMMEE